MRYAVTEPKPGVYRIVLVISPTEGIDLCGAINYAVAMTQADLLNKMRGYAS